jgi:hypothetical protein
MLHLSYFHWFEHSNSIWWRVQISEIISSQFSSSYCGSKYLKLLFINLNTKLDIFMFCFSQSIFPPIYYFDQSRKSLSRVHSHALLLMGSSSWQDWQRSRVITTIRMAAGAVSKWWPLPWTGFNLMMRVIDRLKNVCSLSLSIMCIKHKNQQFFVLWPTSCCVKDIYVPEEITGFALGPPSGILKNTAFRKVDLFPSSDEGAGDTHSVGSVRKS